jgi:2,4-dienoyl-CoA reductase-like NADH-dependent reductase (Old Yellow Enzyme family)
VSYPRIASLKTADAFAARLHALGLELGFDPVVDAATASIFAKPITRGNLSAGNRWAVLPMEGWDGTTEGHPSELTRRRWMRFGESGAKLIWGGEAVAVRHDGRANPNQLVINSSTVSALADLRRCLLAAHRERYGKPDDVLVGLQLTHSGRYSRPTKSGPAPRIAYRHPVLDRRVGITSDAPLLTDDEVARLIEDFIAAAVLARDAGFAFVDIKHCHGYLGHELLSARGRSGRYGGCLENRMRFLSEIAAGIRAQAPSLGIGVRLSAFDMVPFKRGAHEIGVPEADDRSYTSAFGFTPVGAEGSVGDADEFLARLPPLGIHWVCLSAGSPYYNPHIQRPAIFPPSDGYLPPEDPLVGVARQIAATAALKARHPQLAIVGSGYSYLQEWLPHVAQHSIRQGLADVIGVGRLVLSYPELPADVIAGRPLKTRLLCRTFSDCTTAPRNGLVSGCYPLDPFYVKHPQAIELKAIKKALAVPAAASAQRGGTRD